MSDSDQFRHLWGAKVSKDSHINEEILKTAITFLSDKLEDTIEPTIVKEVSVPIGSLSLFLSIPSLSPHIHLFRFISL